MRQTRVEHGCFATALLCAIACGSESPAAAGFEGGPCIQGACRSGLVCSADVCVPAGDSDGDGSGLGGDGGSGGAGSTAPSDPSTTGTAPSTSPSDADTSAGLGDSTTAAVGSEDSPPCEAPTDAELCAGAGVECGDLEVTDRCGDLRQLECGACSGTDLCERGACVADPCAYEYSFCGEGCCPTTQVLQPGNVIYLRMRESLDGSIHMCFYANELGEPDVWYASTLDGANWDLEVVDVVAVSGADCFVYAEPGQPTYISARAPSMYWILYERTGSPWTIHSPPAQWDIYNFYSAPSIGIDLLGQTVLLNDQQNSYWLMSFDSGGFDSQNTGGYGDFSRLLLEPSGLLGSLMRTGTEPGVYRTWDGTGWSDEVVPPLPFGQIRDGDLDDDGEPHFILGTNPITWIHRSAGEWLVEEVPDVPAVGPRIAVGPADAPFIYSNEPGNPTISHLQNGVWLVDPIDADHASGSGDIALAPNGRPVVCADTGDQVGCLSFD